MVLGESEAWIYYSRQSGCGDPCQTQKLSTYHKAMPKPHYDTEYRALARVHWRAMILETDISQGGGAIVAMRLRAASP